MLGAPGESETTRKGGADLGFRADFLVIDLIQTLGWPEGRLVGGLSV